MLTHPNSTIRVLLMLRHLSSGHVTLLPGNFTPPLNFSSYQTYGVGRTQIGLCPKFLVATKMPRCYTKVKKFSGQRERERHQKLRPPSRPQIASRTFLPDAGAKKRNYN